MFVIQVTGRSLNTSAATYSFSRYHAPSSRDSRASTDDIRYIRLTIEHGECARVQTVV